MVRAASRMVNVSLVVVIILLSAALPVSASTERVFVPVVSAPPADRLPDLAFAPLRDVHIQTTPSGRRLLLYSVLIVNVGNGPFEVRAQRSTSAAPWRVEQRIYATNTASRFVLAPQAALDYGGDGHSHWHLKEFQHYDLLHLDTGASAGVGMKGGYCFFDTDAYRLALPGAPRTPVYTIGTVCQGGANGLATYMGLSVGWGDLYDYRLPDQYVDITGLPSGRYRLRATADPDAQFQELNKTNNITWVDLEINGTTVRILGYGPSA